MAGKHELEDFDGIDTNASILSSAGMAHAAA